MLSCAKKRSRSSESQLLLHPTSDQEDTVVTNGTVSTYCPRPKGIFLTSKPVILILIWTMIVGALYCVAFYLAIIILFPLLQLHVYMSLPFVALYSSIALLNLFYPLSGFFADVFFGRFRTIIAGLSLLLISIIVCLTCFVLNVFLSPSSTWVDLLRTVGGIFLITVCIGVAGYNANYIQFGLDQLLDAPSYHQALFVHWAKWCYDFISTITIIIMICRSSDGSSIDVPRGQIFVSSSTIFLFVVFFLLLFTCWKRRWFYSEPGHRNPYKMVIMVLNFARKHKYPLQRSAFTYCDDERPSRLDFAKERYGGPFTTEQVEDVKTFLRIVVILITVGSVFIMDLPASETMMYSFGVHIGESTLSHSWMWTLINCNLLRNLVSTTFLPVYIWVIFSFLRNRVPKIFFRLGLGIFLYFCGILSTFMIDIAGHAKHSENETECIFNVTYNTSTYQFNIPHLDMHWAVYIPSNVFIGIGPTLVTVTIFEFISAQSPHAMKGLLLGTYYAIQGIFQFISSVMLVPVSLNSIWENELYPPHTGCLFGYLLSTCTIALIGLILYSFAARWYVYRKRDDRPYDQRFVIDYYSRYLQQTDDSQSVSMDFNSDSYASQ